MFLSKRKNGYYYLFYKDEQTGIQRKVSTKTKSKTKAKKFFVNFKKGVLLVKPSSINLIHLQDVVLNYVKVNLKLTTCQLYKRAFKEFIKILGNRNINNVLYQDIEYFKQVRFQKVKSVTINIELRTLKASFNLARRLDYINYNPFIGVKQFSEPQKEKMIFTEKEINIFLDGIDNPLFKNLVLIDLYTGLRLSELLNLQWKDVILDERILKIVNKDNHITKTGKIRTIPISDKLFVLLKMMKSEVCEDVTENLYLFQSFTNKPFDKSFVSRKFKFYVKKAKLPEHLHFHNLRHTFITQLIRKGVSIYKVKILAGHSSLKTTEGYTHLYVDDLRDAVNVL